MGTAIGSTFDAAADDRPRLRWRIGSASAVLLLAGMGLKSGFADKDYYALPAFALGSLLAWWRTWQAEPMAGVQPAMRVVLVIVLFFAGFGLSFNGRAAIEAKQTQDARLAEVSSRRIEREQAQKAAASDRLPATVGCLTEDQLQAAGHAILNKDDRLLSSLFDGDVCMAVGGLKFTILDVGLSISRVQVYGDGGYVNLYVFSAFVPTR